MNILQTYLNQQLVKAGFPDDLKIEYSLGYCQGDGVAFYGTLHQDDLQRLFNYLTPNKRKQNMFAKLIANIWEWENLSGIEIYRNSFGHRYSHFNTMTLDRIEAEQLEFFCCPEAMREWYFPKSKVYRYHALWDDFMTDLAEHIRDTSQQLEADGYKIVEATPYEQQVSYCFNTANYRVELVQTPCEFYTEKPEWLFGDLCDVEQMMQSVVDGHTRFANIYAQVIDRQTGLSLGEEFLGNISFATEDKSFAGYKNELISNAIANARENVQKYAQLHA